MDYQDKAGQMTAIAGVLFDKDGTILDFDATWGPATAEVLDALSNGDADCRADLAACCGFIEESFGFEPNSPIIAGDVDDFAPAWASRLGLAYNSAFERRVNTLYRAASLRSLKAYDDVAPALEAFALLGIAIGLATNDSEENARAHLAALGIDARFSFVAGYDSGYGAKPGPGMVLAFADHVGAPPAAIAMVGDSAHDIDAATAAGAVPLGIGRTEAAIRALSSTAAPCFTTFTELLDHLAPALRPHPAIEAI